jgi:hypothetical protein
MFPITQDNNQKVNHLVPPQILFSTVTAQAVILSIAKNLGSTADEILRRKKRSSE